MKKTIVLMAALMLPALALAQGAPPMRGDHPERWKELRERMDQRLGEMHERMQRHQRLARVLEIADALELSDADALKLVQTVGRYEQQKKPYQDTLRDGMETLRKAARGDAAAGGQVDATVQKLVDARSRIQQIDVQLYQELSRGLSADKRAKLALVFARPGGMHGGMGPPMMGGVMGGMMGGHEGPPVP